MAGTHSAGVEGVNSAEWAVKFFNLTFDKFLFVNGDFENWVMATKDQVNGSDYNLTYKRIAMMSSDSQTSYQVAWSNKSTGLGHPNISINDYVSDSCSASKVMHKANSETTCSNLLTKEMKVYINQGPGCDSNATNYQYYSWPALGNVNGICTHRNSYSYKRVVVDKCTPLSSKSSCDAA